jgi:hypothetical protein
MALYEPPSRIRAGPCGIRVELWSLVLRVRCVSGSSLLSTPMVCEEEKDLDHIGDRTLRHCRIKMTLEVYAQAVTLNNRQAQSKMVSMLREETGTN